MSGRFTRFDTWFTKRKRVLFLGVFIVLGGVLGAIVPGQYAPPNEDQLRVTPEDCLEASVIEPREVGSTARSAPIPANVSRMNQTTVRVTYYPNRVSNTSRPSQFRIERIPADVVASPGFESIGGIFYSWRREHHEDTPALYFRVPLRANTSAETRELQKPFFASESWLMAPLPLTTYPADYTVNGSGYAGARGVLFGDIETHSSQVGCQEITAVTVAGNQGGASAEEIATTVAEAAPYVPFNRSFDEVAIFSVPQMPQTRYSGITRGPRMVVRANPYSAGIGWFVSLPWEHPRGVWVHEYVHSRQEYPRRGSDADWFVEASATYYGAEALYRSGQVPLGVRNGILAGFQYRTRHRALENVGRRSPVAYGHGGMVLAAVDARIRQSTNGTESLAHALTRIDGHGYGYGRLETVVNQSSPSAARLLREHVRSNQSVDHDFSGFKSPVRGYWLGLGSFYSSPVASLVTLGLAALLTVALVGTVGAQLESWYHTITDE